MNYTEQMFRLDGLADGDVVGFSGQGFVSDAINVGTYGVPRWGLSHIGIVSTYRGERYLFESTSLNDDPCAILRKPISGVQAHKIKHLLTRPGKVWRYPLQDRILKTSGVKLNLVLLDQLGVKYDYLGAARSGGFLLRIIKSCTRQQNLDKLFCSELVAHALTQIGVTHINNSSAQSPNSLARRLKRKGICKPRIRIK